jgi:hypothetical protein
VAAINTAADADATDNLGEAPEGDLMSHTNSGGQVGHAGGRPQIMPLNSLPPTRNLMVDQLADALLGIERRSAERVRIAPVDAFASVRVTLAARPEASAAGWSEPDEREDDLPRFFERQPLSAEPNPRRKKDRAVLDGSSFGGLIGYLALGFFIGLVFAMPLFWLASR